MPVSRGQQGGWVLKFISGKYQGGDFPVAGNREIVAGRAADLDLVLVEDMVSRKHAKIIMQGAEIWIQDLGSTNGTFVNGERIKKVRLKEGDRVLIGTSILRLERPSGGEAAAVDDQRARARLQEIGSRKPAGPAGGMSGRIEEVPVPDLLQMVTSTKKSGVFVIRGDEEGKIFLRNGQIYYACINENHSIGPIKSIYRIITWARGSYELQPSDSRKFMIELDEDLEVILMEALRIRDELKKIAPKLPPLTRSVLLSMPMAAPLRDLTPEQLDVLQLVYNYGQMKVILDKSPLPDLETLRALGLLLTKGYIREG
ncbi:MAG: FHA domain-containing protein [Deltaproteobacteria bacterium]|nr:FHA domain-containing protein [Deltaproteobacteria bacterium]